MFSARAGKAGTSGVETMVRPHDVIVRRTNERGAVEAVVKHIGTTGPIVRLELVRRDDGHTIEAELSLSESKDLALSPDETVFVSTRKEHVFDDYVI